MLQNSTAIGHFLSKFVIFFSIYFSTLLFIISSIWKLLLLFRKLFNLMIYKSVMQIHSFNFIVSSNSNLQSYKEISPPFCIFVFSNAKYAYSNQPRPLSFEKQLPVLVFTETICPIVKLLFQVWFVSSLPMIFLIFEIFNLNVPWLLYYLKCFYNRLGNKAHHSDAFQPTTFTTCFSRCFWFR